MKPTGESKLFLGILVATFFLIGIAAWALTRPSPEVSIPRETLVSEGTHFKGNVEATAFLVEFSDFQCPACAAFAPTVKSLTDTYRDKLLFVYRHYPLDQHPYARSAAYAAEAAAQQGKFWEAVDYLFANQSRFSDATWETMAKDLNLRMEAFQKDLTSDIIKKPVEQDAAAAKLLNLPGTPAFFLNGVLLKNIYGPQDLVKTVEDALK